MMFNTLALEQLVDKWPFSAGGSRPTALTPHPPWLRACLYWLVTSPEFQLRGKTIAQDSLEPGGCF